MRSLLLTLLLASCAHAPQAAAGPEPVLTFLRDGEVLAAMPRSALGAVQTITTLDPYYGRQKRWRAVELAPLLKAVFQERPLSTLEFVLRATDGYTLPVRGAALLEPGAFLAVADADGPWEPIGPGQANPAPFYLVWVGVAAAEHDPRPRPWALASIAVEPFQKVFPRVSPPEGADARVQRGFAVYREQCFSCHAINQQGGKVGPELNVPRNITEYRDEPFLRAWIRDPQAYRPSVMPAFAALTEAELDAVLAYLRAMAQLKDLRGLPGKGGGR